nr:hypothetical protein [Nocardia wallacei]
MVTWLSRFDDAEGRIERYHIQIGDGTPYSADLPPLAPAEAETLAHQLLRLVAVTKAETGANGHGANGSG